MAKSKGANLMQAQPAITSDQSTVEKEDPIDNYKVRGHLSTLMDAHAIMNDPEKMAKVHALAGRHHKAIRSIKDIKDHYNMTYGPKSKVNLSDLNPKADMEGTGDGGGSE